MPDALFEEITHYLATAFEGLIPFDRIAIVTLDPDGERLTLRGAWNRQVEQNLPPRYSGSLKNSSLATVAASRQPRILNDLAIYLQHHPSSRTTALLVQGGYRSSLTCPLVCRECRSVGFLFFTSRTPHSYQREHAALIAALAEEVSGLLQLLMDVRNSSPPDPLDRLSERLTSLVRTAQAIHQEERLLSQVVQLVNRGMGLTQVLDQIYETFHALLPFDRIGFARLHADTGMVEARWARGSGPVLLGGGFRQHLDQTSLGEVIESGTPRIINDLRAYLADHPRSHATRLIVEEGMRSSLTYAVGPKDCPVAFLFFSSCEASSYSETHVTRLHRLTRPLTTVIEKALLVDDLAAARARSDALLARLMPAPVAEQLKRGVGEVAEQFEVTALFADIAGFTGWSSKLSPHVLMRTLRDLFSRFDEAASRHGVYKLRTIGDAWIAISGIPDNRPDHAAAAAALALDLQQIADGFVAPDGTPIALRIGLNSGPVVAGVLGGSDVHFDVWGPTLSVAARMESHSQPGRVRVSAATAMLLRSSFVIRASEPGHVKSLGVVPTLWLEGPARGSVRESHP